MDFHQNVVTWEVCQYTRVNLKKGLKIAKLEIINYVSVDTLSSKAGYLGWLIYLNQT
jgi:hypothetical protein